MLFRVRNSSLAIALVLVLSSFLLVVLAQDAQPTTPPDAVEPAEPTVTPTPATGPGAGAGRQNNTAPPGTGAGSNQGNQGQQQGNGTPRPGTSANNGTGAGNGTQQGGGAVPTPPDGNGTTGVELPPVPPGAEDILTIVKQSKDHKVLATLIEFANLSDAVARLNEVTVFAPLDRGFFLTLRDLRYKGSGDSERVIEMWKRFLTNSSEVIDPTRLLLYHVMPERRTLAMLNPENVRTSERRIQMISDNFVELESDGLRDEAKFIPNPNYTTSDAPSIVAKNGIIHNIDRVLLYENFNRDTLAKRVQAIEDKLNAESASICFPASATVRIVRGGAGNVEHISLANLKAGHEIHADEIGSTSRVFLFTHRRHNGLYRFTRITTKSGHVITLSGSHYLYANRRLTAARSVRVGDYLRTVSGESAVVRVETVLEKGLFAPHTMHGDVLVDGVVASSYTTAVHPRVASIMLAPLRAVVRLGLAREPVGALFYNGADNIAHFMPRGPEVY